MDTSKVHINFRLYKPIMEMLEKEKEMFAYANVQDLITEILRDRYFKRTLTGKKRGRPKKVDETRVLSRKKIFSKDGVPLDV